MLLGTDPEFFLFSKERGFVSASEVFPTKEEPLLSYYGKIFRDGFGVEVNPFPRSCRAELTGLVNELVKEVERAAKKKDPLLRVVSTATAEIPLSYLESLPDDVKMFGCDPSWNAYTREKGSIPLDGEFHPLRYAGGHVHFGLITSTKEQIKENKGYYGSGYEEEMLSILEKQTAYVEKEAFSIIKLLDLTVGLPLSLIFHRKDEFQRRRFYGRAGEFRYQPWGLEYRVPSPRLWNHPVVAGLSLGVGRAVINNLSLWKEKWDSLLSKDPLFEEKLQGAINDGVGGEELLQTVRGFYKKETISLIAEKGEKLWKLSEMRLPSITFDFEYGYGNYLQDALGVVVRDVV